MKKEVKVKHLYLLFLELIGSISPLKIDLC